MRERLCEKLDATRFASCLRRYFDSAWYFITLGTVIVFGFITGFDLYTMMATAVLACLALVVGRDMRYVVTPTLIAVFQMSVEHSPYQPPLRWQEKPRFSRYFMGGAPFRLIVAALIIIAICFLFHCWLRGTFRGAHKRPGRLFYWSLPMAAALIVNGAFSDGYTVKSTVYGILTAVLWVGIYLIYYHGLSRDRQTMKHVVCSCMTALFVLLAELAWIYTSAASSVFTDEGIRRGSIIFGWGIHNNLACLLTVLMPLCFLVSTKVRHGYLFWGLGFLTWGGVVLTFSRSSLLISTAILIISLIAVCFIGRHKRLYRILFGVTAGGALIAGMIVLIRDPHAFVELNENLWRGFGDNGRFEMWKLGMDNFRSRFVNGIGFFGIDRESWTNIGMPGFLHNTFVQLMASCGVLGLITYLVYRARTVVLFVRRPSANRLFLGLMLLALLGTSLFDNHMFNIYPVFYYGLILALSEHDLEATLICDDLLPRPI